MLRFQDGSFRILSSLATCRMARSRCLPIWCCSMIQSPIRCWPLRSRRISSTLNCFPNCRGIPRLCRAWRASLHIDSFSGFPQRVDARRDLLPAQGPGVHRHYAGQRFRKPEIVVRGGRFARLSVEARVVRGTQQGRELMQGRIVFLLEEPSMRVLLDDWLPRLFPMDGGQQFLCIPHEGKSDLDRSIARKLAAWRIPGTILSSCGTTTAPICVAVKRSLQALCAQGGRPETMVRLVCQELEGWYLGDLAALAAALTSQRWIPRRIASVSRIPMPGKTVR